MNNIVSKINEEALDVIQAAQFMGVTSRTIYTLLKRYKESIKEYIVLIPSKGTKYGKLCITRPGLIVLANLKDSDRGNQHRNSTMKPGINVQAKKNVAEIAIAAQTIPQELLNDPFIKLRLQQLQDINQVRQEMQSLKTEIQEVKQLATETPPTDLITSQREFLNDRLRYFCIQTEMSPSYVWKKLHAYMCKESINDYKFGDFKPAIRYLKEMYKNARIEWN